VEPVIAGALIGATGALSVSGLTQWLGLKREDKRLRHAEQQEDKRLRHAEQMEDQRLRHAERLQIDADARAVLDDALAAAFEARDTAKNWAAEIKTFAIAVESNPTTATHRQQGMRDARFAAEPSISRLNHMASRLTIRLGEASALTNAYWKVAAMHMKAHNDAGGLENSYVGALLGYASEAENTPTFDELDEDQENVRAAIDEFAAHAHTWATRA
jgi:hypothetical protein